MNRPKLFKALLIAWSVAWGVLAVLLCVLWVRSYWWLDLAIGSYGELYSLEGCLTCGTGDTSRQEVFVFSQNLHELREAGSIIHSGATYGFRVHHEPGRVLIGLPHWLLALAAAGVAALPWLPHRFSLRTLLIATTLIAMVLGMIVWMSRAG